MRTKKVNRYYCDHCGKGKLQRHAMERHERVCFHNPRRDCPECEQQATNVAANMAYLEDHTLEQLRQHMENCPACTLSACIQINKRDGFDDLYHYQTFKEDLEDYRREKLIASGYPTSL